MCHSEPVGGSCLVLGGEGETEPEALAAGALFVGEAAGFECLAEALDNRIEWGVWGGMTERERRLLLRQRTDVVSWSSVLVGKGKQPVAP